MSIIDNTLASQVPTFDPATPLAQASKLQGMEIENRQAQFKQAQLEIGAEARGLQTYVNTPEFANKWGEAADRMYQKGLLDERAYKQWRNTPSPLLLKSMIASTSDPTLDFRKEQAGIENARADRELALKEKMATATIEGGKIAANFQRGPDGSLVPVKGGPADPEYVRSLNEAKEKPRNMSISDITKLTEEGGKFSQVSGFVDTFKPEFAGYKSNVVGQAANLAGRNLPSSMVPESVSKGADWWQSYDRYKNVIRNDLFGSALTKTEKDAFEAADITPGMDPGTIKSNLARQKSIIENNIKNKAAAMIEAGYKPEVVAKSYGVSLDSLGIKAKGGKGGSGNDAAIQKARDAISKGAPKDAVIKRLQDAGIDPSGL
jgi:hypothetical protein